MIERESTRRASEERRKEREERLRDLGFEDPTPDQRADNMTVNLFALECDRD